VKSGLSLQIDCNPKKHPKPTSLPTFLAFRWLPMCLNLTNDSKFTIVQSCRYFWEFLFELKEVTYRLWNLGLEEVRPKETLDIKVIRDFINSLNRVETRNFDIGRRNYEAVKLLGFSRYDYDLKSIFLFLLVFKICFLMQYECMMHATCRPYTFLTKIKGCQI
jgi:hypothetical protein